MTDLWTRRGALGAMAAGVAAGAKAKDALRPIVVPITRQGERLIKLQIKVEGRDVAAYLDNGADVTGLDVGLVAEIGRTPKGRGVQLKAGPVGVAFGGSRPSSLNGAPATRLNNVDLEVGGAKLKVDPLVAEIAAITAMADRDVKVMLGREVFERWVVALDLDAGRMELHEPKGYQPPSAAVLTPLDQKEQPQVLIEGFLARAMVDLGCSKPFMVSQGFAEKNGLLRDRPVSDFGSMVMIGEKMQWRISPITSLRHVDFGGAVFRNVPVDIIPAGSVPFGRYEAVIGLPMLSRLNPVIDIPRKRMWTRTTARRDLPFSRDLAGLGAVQPEANGVRLTHVARNSPAAAAGLKAGDLIVGFGEGARSPKVGDSLTVVLEGGETKTLIAAEYY